MQRIPAIAGKNRKHVRQIRRPTSRPVVGGPPQQREDGVEPGSRDTDELRIARSTFWAEGIYGQAIAINPAEGLAPSLLVPG